MQSASSWRRPLEDIRILAVEQFGAGPFGSMFLADMGAEIIKIEDRASGGDVGRHVPPFASENDSLYYQTFNRNKKSICIDLRSDEGYAVFLDLVEKSDAVYFNLRGDVPEALRLTYRHLSVRNPSIVCCSLSGYGTSGPRRKDPAYDYILQAMTGWMSLTGEPDGAPTKSGLSLVDYTSGIVAALAVVSGIHAARRDGTGCDCDLSLYDVGISMLTYPATWFLTGQYEVQRTSRSAHPSLVPFQAFEASDGWIVVGVAKEKFWTKLAKVLGRTDLATDPRFQTFAERKAHAADLLPKLDREFRGKAADEWVAVLNAEGIPCGKVKTIGEALNSEECTERGMIATLPHPTYGEVKTVGTPMKMGRGAPIYNSAPAMGEHTDLILRETLGYDTARISGLRETRAVG